MNTIWRIVKKTVKLIDMVTVNVARAIIYCYIFDQIKKARAEREAKNE